MEHNKILIIDDERDLCDILLFNLTVAGYRAEVAYSAEEALHYQLADFDLLLLDVMMPGMSGFELAERLKSNEQTAHIPIIFLTAKDTEDDMLRGFGLGADDYVTKPFSVRELVARVRVVLNRRQSPKKEEILAYEGLVVDTIGKTVQVDGTAVALTRTEFDLLCLLLSHRGQVFSRQQIFDQVWPDDVVVSDRAVDVNIARMRKKIGRYSQYVVSRQGFGYLFEA